MPPKVKTDQGDVVAAAFDVAKREGISAITAHSVSTALGTSVAPIFRVFQTVEELRTAVVVKIHRFHVDYLKAYPFNRSNFMTYGLAYIRFAGEYPHLFDALMRSGFFTPDYASKLVSDQFDFIVESAAALVPLDPQKAQELFYHIWLYTHGVACLVYKESIVLTEEETKQMLLTAYQAFRNHYMERIEE